MLLPNNLNVKEATKISNKLKQNLIQKIKGLEYVAIQIESHGFSSNYFKSTETLGGFSLGRGFGWNRKGRFKDKIPQAQGKGPVGYCICPKCGYKQKHERGTPCSTIQCPKCKTNLERE